jgi:hypothetical protein
MFVRNVDWLPTHYTAFYPRREISCCHSCENLKSCLLSITYLIFIYFFTCFCFMKVGVMWIISNAEELARLWLFTVSQGCWLVLHSTPQHRQIVFYWYQQESANDMFISKCYTEMTSQIKPPKNTRLVHGKFEWYGRRMYHEWEELRNVDKLCSEKLLGNTCQ